MSPNTLQGTIKPLLKVIHIASGDLWAGAEAQIFTLLSTLKQRCDIQLHAIILNPGELAQRLSSIGIDTTVLDEGKLSSVKIFLELRRLLTNIEPDVIHSHRKKENILATLANITTIRCPTVSTIHGAPEHEFILRQAHRQIPNVLNRLCLRFYTNKIVAVSEELTETLSAIYPRRMIATIPNGLDIDTITQSADAFDPKYSENKVHIGIVGRLEQVKRVDIFLETAAILLSEHPNTPWQFHIIGDGNLKEELVTQASKLSVSSKVTFHGHSNHSHSHIKALDLLVMCSDHEGLPMTALETIALRTPIVAHCVGGLATLLEGNCGGVLVRDHEPSAYADSITRALSGELSELVSLGQYKLPEQYSAQTNAERISVTYADLLAAQ